MAASEFDELFDEEAEIVQHRDVADASEPPQGTKRVNVDLPVWMVEKLDGEAGRIGVSRQSILKVWISERLKSLPS